MENKTYVVTAAPPNPNGDLHLGHLSGPFLGSDVLSRYLRQTGHRVHHVSYADEHSCYVPRKAAEIGEDPHRTAYRFAQRMERSLAGGNMLPDRFAHPKQDPRHVEVVHDLFLRLWERGRLEVRTQRVFHCETCDLNLYEAELTGLCQECGSTNGGMYCEACGWPQASDGLAEPRCHFCGEAPSIVDEERIVLPVERYRKALRNYLDSVDLRPRPRDFIKALLAEPLEDAAFTRRGTYGVPVPLPGWEGHIIDTWFAGVCGYLFSLDTLQGGMNSERSGRDIWEDPETAVVHFLGFDCLYSHAVFWPALCMAEESLVLPEQIVTNEFYQLEGLKFSTSRGHAIWGSEFFEEHAADAVRFYLARTSPETEETSFYRQRFDAATRELGIYFGDTAELLVGMVRRSYAGRIPRFDAAAPGKYTAMAQERVDRLAAAFDVRTFSLRSAAEELRSFAVETYSEVFRIYSLGQETAGGGRRLHDLAEAFLRLVVAAYPIMPTWSESVLRHFGAEVSWSLDGLRTWPEASVNLTGDALVGPELRTPLARYRGQR
ncbi:class I tRNA ligase family protein [Saccharopolyspora sp. NPDC002578]